MQSPTVSMMANYTHDIFVSYSRSDEDWVRWTRENLVRALRSLLRPRLGAVSIYVDENIETGMSWPADLATNLARSRLLLAVLSRDYFQSEWCKLELALMRQRERQNHFRTSNNPYGLILPVVIDDGDSFPTEVQEMQGQSLHRFANPFIRPDSPKQEELAELIRERLCPVIEGALGRVPKFDPAWEQVAYEHFRDVFRTQIRTQNTLPSLTLASRRSSTAKRR